MKEDEELIITISFVDKYTGEFLGNDPEEVFAKFPTERQAQFKALCLEALTGKKHKMAK
ncbi:hypothetical protein [Paenibacillus cremeus]|uniref:hypothetical protein n=1 Tax=Paenibacillus cremeus TaxID=2163881 RepID=UPI001648D9E9|nr:hypothetical protein [Paenibacillus cremeus]